MFDNLMRRAKVLYAISPLVREVARRITASSAYQSFVRRKIKVQIANRAVPINLIIETSSLCNAACLMCPYRSLKRARKIMDQPTWEMIISRLKKEKLLINKVFFSGMGEPLIDPDLINRIRESRIWATTSSFTPTPLGSNRKFLKN
jgi:MoaA/NifB/PqqE/SkfB family radical SAM enzyme